MNKVTKRILLGFIIWIIPFISSFFVWDIELGEPAISMQWFNVLMVFTFTIGLAIAAIIYFKNETGPREGWVTGITWYFELIILDAIVLVGLFGMELTSFYALMFTYLNALIISVAIGYITE